MFRTYQCLNCNEVFLKEQDLMGHIKRVHEASTRETELFHRAQASDYSRKKLAYRELRNCPQLRWADVFMMMFAGVVATLLVAFVMGEI